MHLLVIASRQRPTTQTRLAPALRCVKLVKPTMVGISMHDIDSARIAIYFLVKLLDVEKYE